MDFGRIVRGESLHGETRGKLIGAAGVAVILISAASALLPLQERKNDAHLLGVMLLVSGLLEAGVGILRRDRPIAAALPGVCSIAAGAFLLLGPWHAWVAIVRVIITWLVLRSIFLLVESAATRGSVRVWTLIAAVVDFQLAAILLVGLYAMTFAIALFGPSPDIVTSFAWVLAVSFVVTGALLLEIAGDRPRG